MSIYEAEEEEALKKWASSKYAVSNAEHQYINPITMSTLNYGVDAFWSGLYHKPLGDLYKTPPSDFWTFDFMDNPDTSDGSFLLDRDRENITALSKKRYPQVLMRTKLPELEDGDQMIWMGSQNSGHGKTGALLLRYSMTDAGNYNLKAVWGTAFDFNQCDITGALPDTARTEINEYMFQINGPFAEIYINDELVFVGINSPALNFTTIDYPPYTVAPLTPGKSKGRVARRMNILIEVVDQQGRELKHLQHPAGVCPGEIPVNPARTFRLYDWKTDSLMTSGTYNSGTSHKSHPVPIHGYSNKTLLFQADTDSASDGLTIEVLTQEGNWRTYDSLTYSGNSLESYTISGNFPLVRIGYEPSADGASVTDAEAHLG